MTELIAKPVVKNKYWIVEDQGSKVATIQAVDNGGFVYVSNDNRERFNTIKLLSKAYNVKFSNDYKASKSSVPTGLAYDYPVNSKVYNLMWDIKHKFPVFTKTKKSKSFFCAGYYVIYFNNEWTMMHCPKLISLNRYQFYGPFLSEEQMTACYKALTNERK